MSSGRTSTATVWGSAKSQGVMLAGYRAIADIAAIPHAIPADRLDQGIGLPVRFPDGCTKTDRAKYPATVGRHLAALQPGARMEHLASLLSGTIQSFDDIALANRLRVPVRGQD